MKGFEQLPTPPNEWLYKDDEDGYRNFYHAITMPIGSPLLKECTNKEKLAWESTRKEMQEDIKDIADEE